MEPLTAFRLTPWIRRLLMANGIVWVLGITVFTGPWYHALLAFSPAGAGTQPWTPLTYMFAHQGFLHLAFNVIVLAFFGPPVERRMGGTAFVLFYVICGLGAPVMAYAMSLVTPVSAFSGASAAVFGVAAAFAVAWPQARVYIFPFPAAIPVAWLVAFLVALDVVPLPLGVEDGVAHFAHLGGLVFALIYLKAQTIIERPARPFDTADGPTVRILVPHRGEEEALQEGEARAPEMRQLPPPHEPTRDEIAAEVNRVLDKISAQGLASLSAAERQFLNEMSRKKQDD